MFEPERPSAAAPDPEAAAAKRRDAGSLEEDEDEVQDDAIVGVALRWSALAIAVLVVLAVIGVLLVRDRGPREAGPDLAVEAPREVVAGEASVPPQVTFRDVTQEAGIAFVHHNGATGDRYLPETMGAGAAFFDYDQDGDPDLLLVNSDTWKLGAEEPPVTRLYENDGRGRFRDVTVETGVGVRGYGTAVAVGDYDNDGWVDVFLAAVGPNRLLHNVAGSAGRRRFRDVTAEAGVAGDAAEWTTSSAFFDYDNDGDLDLFAGNYVRWSQEIDREVAYTLTGIGRAYGPPLNYQGTFPYLYRNDGGRFVDVSAAAGMKVKNPATGGPVAKALGVLPIDADLDGDLDLLVANDTVRNFFFRNLGDGFEEVGELYGLAYGRDGAATGAMGVDAGDYRNDGSLGFAIGNFANEMTSLYVSQGDASLFADEAIGEGIGAPSRRFLKFGVQFFDYDLDGRLDLVQVNGHLESEINQVDPSQQYRQPPQLFWNAGPAVGRTFVEVDPATTGDLARPLIGRGSAIADIDGDGDLDLVLTQTGDRPVVLRNELAPRRHWLRVRLIGNGRTSNRDAIGARVQVESAGVRQHRQVMPSRSYQSQSELVLTFGLGGRADADRVQVTWPDGEIEVRENVPGDQTLTLEQIAAAQTAPGQ